MPGTIRAASCFPPSPKRAFTASDARGCRHPTEIGQLHPVPLLQDRDLPNGFLAAYVCRDFTCQAPVTEPEGLRAQLQRG